MYTLRSPEGTVPSVGYFQTLAECQNAIIGLRAGYTCVEWNGGPDVISDTIYKPPPVTTGGSGSAPAPTTVGGNGCSTCRKTGTAPEPSPTTVPVTTPAATPTGAPKDLAGLPWWVYVVIGFALASLLRRG